MAASVFAMDTKECVGELQIVLSTISFSCAFIGQRFAMVNGHIGPVTFNATRYLASLLLLVIIKPILRKYATIDESATSQDDELYLVRNGGNRSLLFWIFVAGISNFGGSMLQQYSLVSLDAAKVAFITGSYVVLIPFVEWLLPSFYGHIPNCISPRIWIGVIVCVVGLFYISGCSDTNASCLSNDSDQTLATIAVMLSVIFWAVNLMMADLASKQVDCLSLTMGEFVIVIALTTVTAVIVEPSEWVYPYTNILQNWKVIMIVGFFDGFAYFLSTVGQMYVRPSRASILFSGLWMQ